MKSTVKKLNKGANDDDDKMMVQDIGLGLNISEFEEDPVQMEFMLSEIICKETDKEKEVAKKEERR